MSIIAGVFDFVKSVFKPATELIDNLHTSDEERSLLKNELEKIQSTVLGQMLDAQKAQMDAQMQVIKAEAQSESKITRMWRPIAMMVFLLIIVYQGVLVSMLGLPSVAFETVPVELWDMLKIGLGGYVFGRSAEKFALNWKKE